MKLTKSGQVVLTEAQIEATCVALMVADGWTAYKMEQIFSEKKRKSVGIAGMADHLFLRYQPMPIEVPIEARVLADVLWCEFKRVTASGRATKASTAQHHWHTCERAKGALTVIAGIDFPATIEGFQVWYRTSGLARKVAA